MSIEEPQRITITICGDGGCGKSSITLRLVRSQWTSDYDPTIEDSYTLTRVIDGKTYHLSLTDTAGQEEYRGMWASSNLRSDAFLLVYDITNLQSLDVLEEFNELIEIEAETRQDVWAQERDRERSRKRRKNDPVSVLGEGGPVKPVKIVAGNKCDLQESRQVPSKIGLDWARKRGCGFMETSARNTVNIEETFALIVRRVVEARRVAMGYPPGTAGGVIAGEGSLGGRSRAGSRGTMGGISAMGSGIGMGTGTGTRRATTAPLSPLPGGRDGVDEEKRLGGVKREGRFRRVWRRLRCWRK